MWWIYYNSGIIASLMAFSADQPHYTVAYKILFELVVLGIVPGTTFEIGFITSLTIIALILICYLLYKNAPKFIHLKLANN
jgi:hypothetical protein